MIRFHLGEKKLESANSRRPNDKVLQSQGRSCPEYNLYGILKLREFNTPVSSFSFGVCKMEPFHLDTWIGNIKIKYFYGQ